MVETMTRFSPRAYFRLSKYPPPSGLLLAALLCGLVAVNIDGLAIAARARAGTATPADLGHLWRFVLLLGAARGLRASFMSSDLDEPGFAATLPWLRERLVTGRALSALGCMVLVAGLFSWLRLPVQGLAAVGLVAGVFALSMILGDVFVDIPGHLTVMAGIVLLVFFPAPLAFAAARAPVPIAVAGLGIAWWLFRRSFHLSRESKELVGSATVDPDTLQLNRVLDAELPAGSPENVEADPVVWRTLAGMRRWVSASMEEQAQTLRGLKRQLLVGGGVFALLAWGSSASLVIFGLIWPSQTHWDLTARRLHPMRRGERARFAYVATLLWLSARYFIAVTLVLAGVTIAHQAGIHMEKVSVERVAKVAAFLAVWGIPVMVWSSTAIPRQDRDDQRFIVPTLVGALLLVVGFAVSDQLITRLADGEWTLQTPMIALAALAVASYAGSWFAVRRRFLTKDLV